MRQGLRAWFLGRLDQLLTEAQRRAPPEELGRARVVVGAAGLLLLLAVGAAAVVSFSLDPSTLVAAVGFSLSLLLLRTQSSYRPAALLLCATLSSAYVLAAFYYVEDTATATYAACMLVPALAVYLLGPRSGLAFALLMGLALGVAYPLYLTHQRGYSGSVFFWRRSLFLPLCMLCGWALSWLHSAARDEAHAALERALKTLRESEDRLVSLIESTEDLVGSLDLEGRLLTANTALKYTYSQLFGRELRLGEPLPLPVDPKLQGPLAKARAGERVRMEYTLDLGERSLALDVSLNPIKGEAEQLTGFTLFARDVTERREADARLVELNRSLLDVSRQAGMAEIAAGILHNVGNTLNSVNVSASLVVERLGSTRAAEGLLKAAELLRASASEVLPPAVEEARGRKLSDYLVALSGQLSEERTALMGEMRTLVQSIEHIEAVVGMHQQHARIIDVIERVSVPELINDALRLHATSFERLGIHVQRELVEVPEVLVDRHKLLQILINLLSNARHALLESGQPDRRLVLRVEPARGAQVRIQVVDNGVGIAPENLARMFTQGFTTKRQGHGLGLHTSALVATQMKGRLTCSSEGLGRGATFTLELPLKGEEDRT